MTSESPSSPLPDALLERDPVFIVGPPRSGTTLLCTLVNQHPDIALMHEAGLVLLLTPSLMQQKDWLARLNFRSRLFQRHQLELTDIDPASITSPRAAIRAIYALYAKSRNARLCGEKMPGYIRNIPELLELFPNARIIVIWREIGEVCRSLQRMGLKNRRFREAGRTVAVFRAYDDLQALLATNAIPHEALFHASYPRMLQDTENLMKEIAQFLGVAFDPEMTNIGSADQNYIAGSGKPLGDRIARAEYKNERPLPARLLSKIDRYNVRWAKLYPDLYPAHTGSRPDTDARPDVSPLELRLDRAAHAAAQCKNRLKDIILHAIPLSWWDLYRRLRPTQRPKRTQKN